VTDELDLTGEVCPFTFVRARLRIEELPAGAVLVVTVDHAPASRSVPRSLGELGHQVLSVTELDGRWRIAVRKQA
jgi:tRNA 2-thiouridine synthesizing protein A